LLTLKRRCVAVYNAHAFFILEYIQNEMLYFLHDCLITDCLILRSSKVYCRLSVCSQWTVFWGRLIHNLTPHFFNPLKAQWLMYVTPGLIFRSLLCCQRSVYFVYCSRN